jgi:hypothetical protein
VGVGREREGGRERERERERKREREGERNKIGVELCRWGRSCGRGGGGSGVCHAWGRQGGCVRAGGPDGRSEGRECERG